MGLFQQLEGEAAIIVQNGVYKQVDLFTRNGYIYARTSGGFVRLNADASTTKPGVRLDTLDYSGELRRDGMGRLCTPAVSHSTLVVELAGQKLLGNNPS